MSYIYNCMCVRNAKCQSIMYALGSYVSQTLPAPTLLLDSLRFEISVTGECKQGNKNYYFLKVYFFNFIIVPEFLCATVIR